MIIKFQIFSPVKRETLLKIFDHNCISSNNSLLVQKLSVSKHKPCHHYPALQ